MANLSFLRPLLLQLTRHNDMTFGPTHAALDDLTYFEEQLFSPIQPVVRTFTLYGTGLTEGDHVAHLEGGFNTAVLAVGSANPSSQYGGRIEKVQGD